MFSEWKCQRELTGGCLKIISQILFIRYCVSRYSVYNQDRASKWDSRVKQGETTVMSLTTATEYAKDMLEKGELKNAAEANVLIVRMMGVRVIEGSIPLDIRRALQAAVKEGKLGRLPKKGDLPEAFFHPNGKTNAIAQRERVAQENLEAKRKALLSVCVHHADL